jgi:hypothetical protein
MEKENGHDRLRSTSYWNSWVNCNVSIPKILIFSMGLTLLESGAAASQSNNDQASPTLERQYQLSCFPEHDDPFVLTGPSLSSVMSREIKIDRGFSFVPHLIVESDGRQFLSGYLFSTRGLPVYSEMTHEGVPSPLLFVLSEQWNCALYRGGERWPQKE